jgi:hypothetical protein
MGPQLATALATAREARAAVVVAKLDRLSRDVHFISGPMTYRVPFGEPPAPDRALDLVDKALVARPNWHSALRGRIECLVRRGHLDEARKAAQQFQAISPEHCLSAYRGRWPHRTQVLDTILGLLRQAGLSE